MIISWQRMGQLLTPSVLVHPVLFQRPLMVPSVQYWCLFIHINFNSDCRTEPEMFGILGQEDSNQATEASRNINRTFWEELVTYFSLTLHGPHRKRKIRDVTRSHRQQGDLISLLTKMTGGHTKTNGQSKMDTQSARRYHKHSLIFWNQPKNSSRSFSTSNMKNRVETTSHTSWASHLPQEMGNIILI
jgi:hypothetical protein